MMPHIARSVSHAPGNGAEIYVAQPRDRLFDRTVSQLDAEGAVLRADAATTQDRHPKFARERLDGGRALGRAGDHGATVGFAEQHVVRRKTYGVRLQIDVETQS